MKLHKFFLASALLAIVAAAVPSCTEDPEMPPMLPPVAENLDKVNTTLLDLKTAYWASDRNYVKEIGLNEAGEHIYVKGRVVSSDKSGNIYKSVILVDSTAALTLAIDGYDLYKTYQFGQEVVIDMTGLKIGGYNGLMQLGGEGVYNNAPSMTFMDSELFAEHAKQNGLSRPALVDTLTVTISDLAGYKSNQAELIKWQSQLVRLDSVKFEDAGLAYAADGNANRYVTDNSGNRMLLRCSSYASFAKDTIPSGFGSIVGILSYYGSDWQMLMIDAQSAIGFDTTFNPGEPPVADNLDKVNTTLLDLKTAYWASDRNYVNTVGNTEAGEPTIVKGRVVSSDESGNIYKSLVISDGTASLAIAINSSRLYQNYPVGQELVINASDLKIGGYNGLMQLGGEGEYNGAPSMTFMDAGTFAGHTQLNGLPDRAAVDTTMVEIPAIIAAKASSEGLILWQSRLVRVDNVAFEDQGVAIAPGKQNTNRYVADAAGNRLNVRCSGYATFANNQIPSGRGSLVGILSYYGTDWQLLMIDEKSMIGFDGSSEPDPVLPPAGDPVTSFSVDFQGITAFSQLPGWNALQVTGTHNWRLVTFKENTYAQMTNFQSGSESTACETWLITPALDVDKMTAKTISFETSTAYQGDDRLEVFVLDSADPKTATRTALEAHIAASPQEGGTADGASPYSVYESSGNLSLAGFSGVIYVGFRYTASAGSKFHTYCVDNIVAE